MAQDQEMEKTMEILGITQEQLETEGFIETDDEAVFCEEVSLTKEKAEESQEGGIE